MRNVVLYQLVSLDGVAEEPGDWFTDGGPELFENLGEIIGTQDAILLGRGTYDYWVDFWPTSEVEPFASFINDTEKHVFTSSPPDKEWPNSTFVNDPAAEYVAQLKEQPGGDIGIHGSIELAQSLWAAGLIDELKLVVGAAVAGHGRRLFKEDGTLQQLDLAELQHTARGSLLVTYRRPDGAR